MSRSASRRRMRARGGARGRTPRDPRAGRLGGFAMSLRCTLLPIAASLAIPVAAIAGSDATTGTDGWMPFDTGMDGSVNAVALHRGQLYAGGGFQTASGVPAA